MSDNTETTRYDNSSGTDDWFQVSDGSHDHVCFQAPSSALMDLYVGSDNPPTLGYFSQAIPGGFHHRVDKPNAPVWLKIKAMHSITVMVGDAQLRIF